MVGDVGELKKIFKGVRSNLLLFRMVLLKVLSDQNSRFVAYSFIMPPSILMLMSSLMILVLQAIERRFSRQIDRAQRDILKAIERQIEQGTEKYLG